MIAEILITTLITILILGLLAGLGYGTYRLYKYVLDKYKQQQNQIKFTFKQ